MRFGIRSVWKQLHVEVVAMSSSRVGTSRGPPVTTAAVLFFRGYNLGIGIQPL
jgi:hypothetical protein